MVKYSCPVCDRVMKGQHYCSFCRQYVKTPYVSKVNYYLNERHLAFEPDCEYHGKPESYGKPEAYGETEAQAQLERVMEKVRTTASGMQRYVPQAQRNQTASTQKTSSGLGNIFTAIFLILFLINFMGSCIVNY